MCIVQDFIATNGITRCAPARAQGANSTDGSRRHVSKVRAAWSKSTGVALKVGMVKGS